MNLIKKVSIILLCLMVFSFCVPGMVQANDNPKMGKLMDPIMSFFVGIGDGIITLIQKLTIGLEAAVLEIDASTTFWAHFWGVLAAVLVTAAFVIGAIATGGVLAYVALGVKVVLVIGASVVTWSVTETVVGGMLPDSFVLPVIEISPQEIFSGDIQLLDVDFFSPMADKTITNPDGTTEVVQSTAKILQSTVSKWYQNLRDIAIVALLSILVYIGIRILISSTSNDKAKYKQMIVDWVVALCLLFVMQYIMSFSNIIVKKVIELVNSSQGIQSIETTISGQSDAENYVHSMSEKEINDSITEGKLFTISAVKTKSDGTSEIDDDIKKKVEKAYELLVDGAVEKSGGDKKDTTYYQYFKTKDGQEATDKGSAAILNWPCANYTAYARMQLQLLDNNNPTYMQIGYKIIYVVLVIYTVIFLFTYVRRVLYMAFLTIIAPLVAMTYPIDKINDGKAQAFDMWLKEYIFNLLIQPLHLLLYYILITSAINLANDNILYVVLALGFMMPAEKLMRKFFGFEKAQTPGMLAGPAGAAMMMAGVNNLLSKGAKGGSNNNGKGGSSSSSDDKENSKPPRMDFDTDKHLADGNDTDNDKINDTTIPEEKDEDKTDLQKMSDADYENNWLGADQHELETMDANAREAYGDGEGMKYTDEEMEGILRDSGYSDEEIAEYMKDYNKDNNSEKPTEIDDNSQQESQIDTNDIPKDNEENSSNKPKRSLKRGLGRAARMYGHGLVNKAKASGKYAHPVKNAIRMAGGLTVGATAATAGLMAGVVSGDPSKAFQYTTAGALGGYKVGSGMANKISDGVSVDGISEEFKKGYYTKEEYKDRQIQKNIRIAKKDYELRQLLEERLGDKEKAKNFINNSLDYYVSNGIDGKKDLAAVAQMQELGVKREKIVAVAKTEQQYAKDKDTTRLSGKEDEELNKTLLKRAKRNQYVANDENAQQQVAKNTRDLLDQYTELKNKD